MLLKPDASMVSAASTVMEFCTPDTVRLAQWPVTTTVLETPLTLTMLLLQAMVRLALMPETLSGPPGGGVGAPADGGRAPGVFEGGLMGREAVGGDEIIDRTPESWCAAKAAMPPARAIAPTTMTVPTIHHTRLPPAGLGGGPRNGPP